jgi:hypothetical protein
MGFPLGRIAAVVRFAKAGTSRAVVSPSLPLKKRPHWGALANVVGTAQRLFTSWI